MRITLIQCIAAVTLCGVTLAHPVKSQSLDSMYVTVELNNESIENVFKQIQSQSGLLFAYQYPQIEKYTAITLAKERRSIRETLDRVFNGTPLAYRKVDQSIIIFLRHDSPLTSGVMQTVTGTITNGEGVALPGVNVLEKGTINGTASDADGKYTLDVEEKAVLVFSFIGFKSVEMAVNGQPVIDVALEEDATTLKEVVINGGYYTTSRATSTGNIAQVKAEEISRQPVVNPLQALQGRISGVEIVQLSGVPGGSMTIQIRGRNSLTSNGNYPLYIIDGVPVSSEPLRSGGRLTINGIDPLNTISPENIESVEILKDAEATAIYGSRGANGVVLITTKKAAKDFDGRTSLEANFYTGAGKAHQLDLLSRKQYLTMRKEAFKNDNLIYTSNPGDIGINGKLYAPDLTLWDTARYTDWQDVLIGGTANTTDMQLALSGGNSTTSFRISGGYHKETGVFPGDFGYNRFSGGLSVTHRSHDRKFSVTASGNYGVDNNDLFDANLVPAAINLAPVGPKLYNADGTLNWQLDGTGKATWYNPLAGILNTQKSKSDNLIVNALVNYEILPGLKLKTSLGFNRQANDELMKVPNSSLAPGSSTGNSTTISKAENSSWITEPQLTYKLPVGRKGVVDVLAGASWQSKRGSYLGVGGYNYASDNLLGTLKGAALIQILEDTDFEYRYTAAFGRVSFNWDEKYLVNITGRRDGSSRFGPDNRFASFGAVGLGWVFSSENVIQNNLAFLSFGKLRASYGSAGSDNIGDYGYLSTYTGTTNSYHGVPALVPFELANDSYSWELVKKFETGIELGFLEDRLSLTTSFYLNRSSRSLVGLTLPATAGFTAIKANTPASIENKGIEFVLQSTNIKNEKLTWSTSFNLTIPRQKLVSYPGLNASPDSAKYVIGRPVSLVRLLTYTGVDPQTGYYTFKSNTVRDNLLNVARQYYGGINNSFTYKEFELGFLVEFVKQVGNAADFSLFGTGPGGFSSNGSGSLKPGGNQLASVMNRWQQEGDITDVQRFTTGGVGLAASSNRGFEDTSFIRLKTISLSYNFKSTWLTQLHLQSCSVYVQGQNLFTITKYEGFDPQIPGRLSLPALRMITGGIRVTL